MIEKILTTGHYFSFDYLLQSNLQSQLTRPDAANSQFCWNLHLREFFVKHQLSAVWQINLIQGYVGHIHESLNNKKAFHVYLISRRSRQRGGTRYLHRGVNEEGQAANFVESELIVHCNKNICSYLQIRGSIPLLWGQQGIKSELFIHSDMNK